MKEQNTNIIPLMRDPAVHRARELRAHMSEPEVMLWSRLKHLRARGFHIRRQAPFRGYFLDFVCFPRRLVIEVDGAQHGEDEQVEHDAIRDRMLARHGFRVVRVTAGEVRRNLTGVMDAIVLALEARPDLRPIAQSATAEPGRDGPTLLASRAVPPH